MLMNNPEPLTLGELVERLNFVLEVRPELANYKAVYQDFQDELWPVTESFHDCYEKDKTVVLG